MGEVRHVQGKSDTGKSAVCEEYSVCIGKVLLAALAVLAICLGIYYMTHGFPHDAHRVIQLSSTAGGGIIILVGVVALVSLIALHCWQKSKN